MGGGRRRSVVVPNSRLKSLRCRLGRLQVFRTVGGNSAAYVRAAAIPAVTYGAEVMGVADSQLQNIRSAIARAAAPPTGGKNAGFIFHALEADGQTCDPAIVIHALAIGAWACAWWDNWIPQDALMHAYCAADTRIAATCKSPWQTVTGPVAAVILTARRIGWEFSSPRTLRDDVGRTWDLLRESPAAVKHAVAGSVRRWRFRRIVTQFPAAYPLDGTHEEAATIVVDLSAALGSLFKACSHKRSEAIDEVPMWDAGCRPWLMSARTGGQWPQARRAAVKAWDADPRCQLCFAQTGTLIHRR